MNSLTSLTPPVATMASAFLGFFGATLVNHWLQRRRTDRDRSDRIVDICEGLLGELYTINLAIAAVHEGPLTSQTSDERYWILSLHAAQEPDTSFYDAVKGDVGFLGAENLLALHSTYKDARILGKLLQGETNPYVFIDPQLRTLLSEFDPNCHILQQDIIAVQRRYLRRADRKAWNARHKENQDRLEQRRREARARYGQKSATWQGVIARLLGRSPDPSASTDATVRMTQTGRAPQ